MNTNTNPYYNEKTMLFFNGKFKKAATTTTDLYGQTLHYGYGAFEGIRAYNTSSGTKIFKATEHYERLKKSCELINIPFQYNIDELIERSYELLEVNNLTDAYLRPIVFCDPNMSLSKPNGVNIMICAWKWGTYLGNNLLNLAVSSYCRPHPKSIKIEAKVCGHYINSILATNEAKNKGFDEALLLDTDNFVAEGPGANLFFEKKGQLFTPQLGNILPGITRATIIELCKKLDIKVHEGQYNLEQLVDADAAFYCGTAAEVVGIRAIDEKEFQLDWEKSLGKKLQSAYKNLVLEQELVLQNQ
ncbi:branched-chain amino acid transaminase [Flavobacterium jejuense]|uniref:Branched-chain-amino-acid aminotransferase n=1 Tax=Flavobacterium jejuense TaxID=1544455 RepID=A0ABX0ISC8_9FLAO|nr:branched-chain amino acid transaminase [Flavobacterium jejuense]NHN25393.1 branched-chain amino acid transaminase [Flavobacterium jejuense]